MQLTGSCVVLITRANKQVFWKTDICWDGISCFILAVQHCYHCRGYGWEIFLQNPSNNEFAQ